MGRVFREYWIPAESHLRWAGFRLIQHRVTGELSLFGRYGEIWEYGGGKYRVMIRSQKVIESFSKAFKIKALHGYENLFTIKETELRKAAWFIKPFRQVVKAAEMANYPDLSY